MSFRIKYIAFADDDPDDIEILHEAVKSIRPDIKFTFAEDGSVLLEKLNNAALPDLIILDINMPVLNGIECLKAIKEMRLLKGIPIMMYSTSSQLKYMEEAFSTGADYYVVKPNNMHDLNQLALAICTGTIKSSKSSTLK